ncbi:MAG TPA: O-antigen ligase family protein [Gaiellaceae bacterium]|nr:O-antigen ligase family protein [Gaiellaceae bacterium]
MDAREAAAAVGVFALVSALGFDEGGYAATAWGWSAVILLAVVAVEVARGARRPGRAALVVLGGLAGFALWTALSIAWTSHVSASVLEVQRAVLYLAAAAAFVLVASAVALLAGTLGAATLLCGYGLTRWLLGDPEVPLSADPRAGERLSEPLGYANGVALLAAIGLLIAVGVAARASRIAVAAVAAATTPLFAATLYFTFGRGAWVALAVGLAVAVALGPRRLQLAAVAAGLAVPTGAAVVAAHLLSADAFLAAVIGVLCGAAAGVCYALRTSAVEIPAWGRTAFAICLVAVPFLAAAAVLVRVGGPDGAYDAFTAAPTPVHGEGSERLFSASGSSRADYWRVAWETYEDEPLLGDGAGTFARTWLADRPIPQPAKDAHSLYLETLSELGPIGLALLALALAAPFAGCRDPVALAPYTAFLAHAAQDWVWELPAVTVAALACGAAMVASRAGPRLPRTLAVVPAVLCIAVALAFAGNRALAEAVAAADRSDYAEAVDHARTARTLQPWSAEPWRLLGEAQLAAGSVQEARRSFTRGLDRDSGDWELWLDLGLAHDGPRQRLAWSRAQSLNPLSPELQELGFADRNSG